ncbi:DIP1281 family NlpC/P60 protein [Corynebacterium sp. ES2794-CONJ1]|uniref:DIP1281 family NlpC/P60 protein n=1 Tax=Corynebacterium sp. ES2794-CONJ1 TaxID=2980553 RepID=UPI0039866B7C
MPSQLMAVAVPTNPSDSAIATAHSEVGDAESSVTALVAAILDSEANLSRVELEMGKLREGVNKAIVDYHRAKDEADQARAKVAQARSNLESTQSDLTHAQQSLNEISRSTYRKGATGVVGGLAGTTTSEDALARQTFLRTRAEKQRTVVNELDRLRTQQANEESLLREARNIAEAKERAALDAKENAERAIRENSQELERRHMERQSLEADRSAAQVRLSQARSTADALYAQREEYRAFEKAETERKAKEAEAARAEAARVAAQQELERKERERQEAEAQAQAAREAQAQAQERAAQKEAAERRAAAEAEAEAARRAQETAAEVAAEQAREAAAAQAAEKQALELVNLAADELLKASDTPDQGAAPQDIPQESVAPSAEDIAEDSSNSSPSSPEASAVADDELDSAIQDLLVKLDEIADETPTGNDIITDGSRSERIEAVIARAQSVIGTPYAWGGGNVNGPTKGIRDGGTADSYGDFNKVGFDCSGLVIYAFAAAGFDLPHYTGYQYKHGTKIDPKNMQRGDLIFYGPNAEYHVAIYLGDGTMIEAPQSGSTVRISDVRWGGMSPYAVRLI